MWISRKEYKFLKENAEKNIDAECEILKIKDEQMKQTARAMIEYSAVLKERDEFKEQVHNLCNLLHAKEKLLDYTCESKNLNGNKSKKKYSCDLVKKTWYIGDIVKTVKGIGFIVGIDNDNVTVCLNNDRGIYSFNENSITR